MDNILQTLAQLTILMLITQVTVWLMRRCILDGSHWLPFVISHSRLLRTPLQTEQQCYSLLHPQQIDL